jgi:hypothetical protein
VSACGSVSVIQIWVIVICFGFRVSCFGFSSRLPDGRGGILEYFLSRDIVFGARRFIGHGARPWIAGGGGNYRLWFWGALTLPIVAAVMGHSAVGCRDIKVMRFFCRYGRQCLGCNSSHDEGRMRMDKKELIDRICEINKTAKPEFLAKFPERQLAAYLEHLRQPDLAAMSVSN